MPIRLIPVAAALTLAAIAAPSGPAEAQQPSCGETYTIQSGDTLSEISSRALGDAGRWPEIYENGRNARIIGSNPNLLQIGDTISLPACPGSAKAPPEELPERQSTASSGSNSLPIDIVTAGDYAPLTDEGSPQRGMLTNVVEAAFRQSGLANPIRIDFINDWGAHLTTLLPKQKYDMGFPWFKPDCGNRASLPESMRVRCDYVWSDPLYSVTIGLYYAPDNLGSQPTSFDDLRGKRICRPAGYYTFDLANRGLRDDDTSQTVTLVRPATVAGCVEALARGEADFLSLNRFTAERTLATNDPYDQIKQVNTLAYTLDLHLVAHEDHAKAAHTWMEAFNDGLRRLRESGQHNRITTYHLSEHRESLADLSQQ